MANWKKVIVSGSNASLNHITASGAVSASGNLFASLSSDSSNLNTVMYNSTTGQFFHTGSYNNAATGISNLEASASAGIYFSASVNGGVSIPLMGTASFIGGTGITTTYAATGEITISSDTGELTSPVAISASNGITSLAYGGTASFEAAGTGLSAGQAGGLVTYTITPNTVIGAVDTATVINITSSWVENFTSTQILSISGAIDAATGSLSASIIGTANEVEVTANATNIIVGLPDNVIIPNNLTVTNDLTVNGTTTSIHTTNLNVSDQFILLASGSIGAISKDGGIIVQTGSMGNGTALFFDGDLKRWGLTGIGETAWNATSASPRQYVVSVSSSAASPSILPSDFGSNGPSRYGMMYIDTSDSAGDGNTIWIYGA
jgi:hypothetical protein